MKTHMTHINISHYIPWNNIVTYYEKSYRPIVSILTFYKIINLL